MLIDLLQRLGEVFPAPMLVFFGLSSLLLLDWIIEDDFFLVSEPPSAYYVRADTTTSSWRWRCLRCSLSSPGAC